MAIFTPGVVVSDIRGQYGNTLYRGSRTPGRPIVQVLGPRSNTRRRRLPEAPDECPCKAFLYCDLIYQKMTPAEKIEWHLAITKPHTSTYDLFMKECLTSVIAGREPPDTPGPGGGWSTRTIYPGTTYPPLIECQPIPDPDEPPDWENPISLSPCELCEAGASLTPLYYTLEVPDHECANVPDPGFYTLYQQEGNPCTWTRHEVGTPDIAWHITADWDWLELGIVMADHACSWYSQIPMWNWDCQADRDFPLPFPGSSCTCGVLPDPFLIHLRPGRIRP